jgi:5-methyltetrahydropteroyltriglutamate--homocysteine methyltransferase
MQSDVAPYRADHVGSLLRSAALKAARAKRAAGHISAAELESIEDAEIRTIIAKQEAVGLRSITDGEFRRAYNGTTTARAASRPCVSCPRARRWCSG